MNKLATLLFLLLAYFSARAYCPSDWLIGDTQVGRVWVDFEDCGPKLEISWMTDRRALASSMKRASFKEECKAIRSTKGVVQSFSCKSGGTTPLAGATYKRTSTGTADVCENGHAQETFTFTCAAECPASAPKVLTESAGCD